MSLDFDLVDPVKPADPDEWPESFYEGNITHNLITMASKAGIYKCLWRPEENGFFRASQIIPYLERGINEMKKYPSKFKAWDCPNGWGTYENFLPFCEEVLAACREFPDSAIQVSR